MIVNKQLIIGSGIVCRNSFCLCCILQQRLNEFNHDREIIGGQYTSRRPPEGPFINHVVEFLGISDQCMFSLRIDESPFKQISVLL